MKTPLLLFSMVPPVLGVLLASVSVAPAQTPGGQTSNYLFRFNTGVSSVFLNQMTFQSEQPLNLGACTTTEKINGPLSCSLNCENQAVCLLSVSGPSGASVTDVMEIASETPVSSSLNAAVEAGFGSWITEPSSGGDSSRRIEAYRSSGG